MRPQPATISQLCIWLLVLEAPDGAIHLVRFHHLIPNSTVLPSWYGLDIAIAVIAIY